MTQQELNIYQDFLVSYEQRGWTGELVKYGRLARNEDKTLVAVRKFDFSAKNNSDTGCSSYFFGILNSPTESPFQEEGPDRNSLYLQSLLINCTDQKLPFMCTKTPKYETIKLSKASICPNGWLGNESFSTCYKLFHEVYMDYWAAKLSCETQGSSLMKIHTDEHLEKAFQIVTSPHNRFSQNDGLGRINLWIDGRDESCYSYFPEFNRTLKWNCKSGLPYICSKPVAFNSSTPRLNLIPPYLAQEIPIRNGESEIIITSTQKDEEIQQSFRCLVNNLKPERQTIQWVKDGYMVPTYFDSEEILRFDGSLTERLYDEGTGTTNNRFTNRDLLGYYWCEVLDLKSNSMKASNKFYLNYRGTRTYAASLNISDKLFDQFSANDFNLMRVRYPPVESILSFFGNTTRESITVKLNRFRSKGRIIDFQVFESSLTLARRLRSIQNVRVENAKAAFLRAYNIKSISNGKLIKFVSTDYCLETKRRFTYDDGTIKNFNLPDTLLGRTWYTPDICPVDQLPIGQVECNGDKIYGAFWGAFQLNINCQFIDHSSSSVTVKLAEIAKNITNSSNIDGIIKEVEELTEDADVLTTKDISYSTSILDKIVEHNNITKPNAIGIVNIINNIQDSRDTILDIADKDCNVTKRILTTLDRLDTKLITGSNNFLSVVTSKTVLEIRDLDPLKPIQIGLSANGGKDRPVTSFKEDDLNSIFYEHDMVYETADVGIYLNREFVGKLANELKTTRIRLAMRLFNDSTLFISNNSTSNRFLPNSKIISATLLVNDIPYTDLNDTYITAVFLPYKPLQTEVRQNFSICAFWNIEAGQWSSEGCEYKNTTSGRDVCICDHLTNFAVLLDYYGQDYLIEEVHRLALSIITIIGLTLSIIGLGLTILSFILFSKLRKGRPQQTLFNLALAMLCSWIVFLAGINQTDDYDGCIAVAVLLHYFILASFMWMLMEGILQYLLFVRVLGTYFENYMWKTAISAWVLPLVPIIVMLAIDIDLYNGGNTYCWMSLTGFYYGFSIPVGVIILANIIIYIMVTCSICNRRNINTGDSKSTSRSTLTNIRASFCCFIILGVSWIFGFLAISDARLVFQYIFTIINSIQGFLIFALFTLRDKNVRDYWQELCCYRSKFNGQSSKQRTKTSSESAAKNSSDLTFSDVRKNSTTVNDINSNDQRQEPYTQQL